MRTVGCFVTLEEGVETINYYFMNFFSSEQYIQVRDSPILMSYEENQPIFVVPHGKMINWRSALALSSHPLEECVCFISCLSGSALAICALK